MASRVEALAKGARERSAPHQCWVALRAHSLHSAQVRRQAFRGESPSALNQRRQDSSLVSMVNLTVHRPVHRQGPSKGLAVRQLPPRIRKTRRESGSGGAVERRTKRQIQVAEGQRSSSSCVNLGMKLEALFKERRTGAGGQHRTDTGNGARLNTGGAHASLGCACRTI